MSDTHKKSILKSIIWRVLGVIILATIVYLFTGNWITTGLITIIHHATFLLVFYLHERVWLKVESIRGRLRRIIKALTYEVMLGMGLGGLIVLMITGSWSAVTHITITYTIIKLITYYLYEKAWSKTIVYVYMTGDIIHSGHLEHLENAKKLGNVTVGVLTEEAVMQKKPKPIISLDERIKIMSALRVVDKVIPQLTYSPLGNVKEIKPDILMETSDHSEMGANDYVKSYGGKVVITEVPNSIKRRQSSTKIKNEVIKRLKQEKSYKNSYDIPPNDSRYNNGWTHKGIKASSHHKFSNRRTIKPKST